MPSTETESYNLDHSLRRQLRLRDVVFAQVLTVVGSSWVGIAAGLGPAQFVVWILAFGLFYAPMATGVYFLNREMPLEGGLYVWAREAFGDMVGFMTAWNIWAYALASSATMLYEIPTEAAYMIGPRAAAFPEDHLAVFSLLAALVSLLTLTALFGLRLGRWIHNISGASTMIAFALLIAAPVWAWRRGAHLHYAPISFHLPAHDLLSLSLLGQILFATSGLEYVAITAGETEDAERTIGLSVIIATPAIFIMLVLGTASVVSLHQLHPEVAINFVAPIPQALTQAFGQTGGAAILAKFTILLLQVRVLGAVSFLFTGATRLPMTAGWDHLLPEWFTRLNHRRIPANSILFTGMVIAALLVLGSAGVHAAEAFGVLNDASSEFYALAYLVMFLIPLCSARVFRNSMPRWGVILSAAGVLSILFSIFLNAYPFVEVASSRMFALKIVSATFLVNLLGYSLYISRRRRVGTLQR